MTKENSKLNRREFFKCSSAAAFLAAAPYVIADDKTGTRLPVVGEGEHQYEVIHDWGELPAGHVYGNTHGVAVDAQGEIHIKHTVGAGSKFDDAVVVFDANGKFIRSWGREYKGGAHGLHLSTEGKKEFFICAIPNGIFSPRPRSTENSCGASSHRSNAPAIRTPTNSGRPTSPVRRAVIFLWLTATAKVSSINTTAMQNISALLAARANPPAMWIARTA